MRGIVENESNRESLEKFRKIIEDMKKNKVGLFLTITCLIFVIIIFLLANKDEKVHESDDKSFRLFFILFIIFLIYKITSYFIEYNNLCKKAVIYYSYIIK